MAPIFFVLAIFLFVSATELSEPLPVKLQWWFSVLKRKCDREFFFMKIEKLKSKYNRNHDKLKNTNK